MPAAISTLFDKTSENDRPNNPTGTEIGKNWLEANWGLTALPTTLGPATVGDGEYTVTVDRYPPGTVDGRYRIAADALP